MKSHLLMIGAALALGGLCAFSQTVNGPKAGPAAVGRFQLCQGKIDTEKDTVNALFRIDTATGGVDIAIIKPTPEGQGVVWYGTGEGPLAK